MNITRNNVDALNAIVTVEVAKNDYAEKVNKVLADCIYDALSICPIHAKHLVYVCENYEIGFGLDYRPTEVVVVLQYGYKKGEN